jgi:putative transposase
MVQLQPSRAAEAEFVICDQTIERTFGWLNRYRRLSKDYEQLPAHSEAVIRVTLINLMVQRLARHRAAKRRAA